MLHALSVEHPGELAADFREFYHIKYDPGSVCSWREAWLLVNQLLADPRSRLQARLAGWSHPTSFTAMAVCNLSDITIATHTPKGVAPGTVPRPWDGVKPVKPLRADARAILAARGGAKTYG
jgi:hypothetical protein